MVAAQIIVGNKKVPIIIGIDTSSNVSLRYVSCVASSVPENIFKLIKIQYFNEENTFKIFCFQGDHTVRLDNNFISNNSLDYQKTINHNSELWINDAKFIFSFNTEENENFRPTGTNKFECDGYFIQEKNDVYLNNLSKQREATVDNFIEPPKTKQSWIKLLRKVFFESGQALLKLKQIYEIALCLQPDLEKFTNNGKSNSSKWKSAIRHTLSISPWFTKSGQGNGKFGYWSLSDAAKLKLNQDPEHDAHILFEKNCSKEILSCSKPPLPSSFYSTERVNVLSSDFKDDAAIMGQFNTLNKFEENKVGNSHQLDEYMIEVVNEFKDISDTSSNGSMEARRGDHSPLSLPSSATNSAPASVRLRKPSLKIDTQSAVAAIKFGPNDTELWSPQTFNESCFSYINSRIQESVNVDMQKFNYPTPTESEKSTPPFSPNPAISLTRFSDNKLNTRQIPASPYLRTQLRPAVPICSEFSNRSLLSSEALTAATPISAPITHFRNPSFGNSNTNIKADRLLSQTISVDPYAMDKNHVVRSNQYGTTSNCNTKKKPNSLNMILHPPSTHYRMAYG
ncbi:hypothetical protein HK099_005752 [Clydaea vesicula]|uniref:Fork-head domain-containing protein n=1 Tax=Clydaea vesicula TaxID=447962 RepID=A0AAD5XZF5_9FUNG|nr:hypothetical protein HK099_005752 [Clydaea vesicula]